MNCVLGNQVDWLSLKIILRKKKNKNKKTQVYDFINCIISFHDTVILFSLCDV